MTVQLDISYVNELRHDSQWSEWHIRVCIRADLFAHTLEAVAHAAEWCTRNISAPGVLWHSEGFSLFFKHRDDLLRFKLSIQWPDSM